MLYWKFCWLDVYLKKMEVTIIPGSTSKNYHKIYSSRKHEAVDCEATSGVADESAPLQSGETLNYHLHFIPLEFRRMQIQVTQAPLRVESTGFRKFRQNFAEQKSK